MAIVKKWGITALSFVAGVLALVFSLFSGMKTVIFGMADKTEAYKVITDKDIAEGSEMVGLGKEFDAMKIFSIILMVIAILLIIYAVLSLLVNLNVLKIKAGIIDFIGAALFVLFVVSAFCVLGTSMKYADKMQDVYTLMVGPTASVKVGVYQPLMALISALTAIIAGAIAFVNFFKR